MAHLIEIRDMYKIYAIGEEPVHALDGVSLSIDDGEFVAIMGSWRSWARPGRASRRC